MSKIRVSPAMARVWLEMHDKKKNVIPSFSMSRDATDNAMPIGGGNVVVPH